MEKNNPETWKPIPDFPGYEVSDHGRVRSYFKRAYSGKRWGIAKTPQRIMKQSSLHDKYLMIRLRKNGRQHHFLVHRLVMLAFVGSCPAGLEACHNNGDSTHNHLSNLRYDTRSNNLHDAVWHGGRLFNPSEILEIRNKRANGIKPGILAEQYETSPAAITQICNGTYYKSVGGPITQSRPYCLRVPALEKLLGPPPVPAGNGQEARER